MDPQRKLAAAIKRLDKLEKSESFDPSTPGSKPTNQQQAVFKDIETIQHRYVIAGNQCKPGYSKVLMADGSLKEISKIEPGEKVFTFDTKTEKLVPSTVIHTWKNGIKPVYRYSTGSDCYTDATDNHEMVRYLGTKYTKFSKQQIGKAKTLLQSAAEFEGTDSIDPIKVELLGYLLGDGCLRITRPDGSWKGLQFTNTNAEIVSYVEALLNDRYYLRAVGNGDYFISKRTITGEKKINEYVEFIRSVGLDGKLAYNKFIPEVVFTQSLDTRRKFIAGMIATDGYISKNRVGFSTTSIDLAQGMKRILASVGIFSTINRRTRNNPNHRDELTVNITKREQINKFLTDIIVPGKTGTIVAPPKPYRSYGNKKIIKSEYVGEMPVFDITVDHPDHNYICDGYVTGNSGKSALAAREIAWILNDNHPFWTRPTRWGDEPLLVIIAGQDRKMMEIELWEKKLALFLNKSEWRGMRQGGTLQYVENRKTGDKVVFLSHSDSSEKNRKHMQGYVAHFVWLDEMPSKVGILEELQRRVDARRGYLLATFTPKFRNDEIRKIIEAAEPPLAKKYRLSKLDNPLYRDRLDEELQKLNGYNEGMKAAILYGDWMIGEGMVYDWNPEFMEQEPDNYSYAWRHVIAVDPALKSKCGFTLWAEEPRTGIWYLVKDEYITGILDPESLALEIENRIKGYNVIRRITDTMAWFVGAANKLGITYMQPYDKNNRKDQLIKSLQSDLSHGKIKIAPWCTAFKDEILSCQWSDTSDKIINSSSYHTLDSSQYFVDCKPKHDSFVPGATWHEELRRGNQKRKEQEKIAKKVSQGSGRVKPIAFWTPRKNKSSQINRKF